MLPETHVWDWTLLQLGFYGRAPVLFTPPCEWLPKKRHVQKRQRVERVYDTAKLSAIATENRKMTGANVDYLFAK